MTSTSAVMLCLPQKSSISCVSAIPPISEPERLRRLNTRPKPATARGFGGAPTSVILPSRRSELDVCVNVVFGRDGVEDEVEAAGVLLHLLGISGNDHVVRSQAESIFFLVR